MSFDPMKAVCTHSTLGHMFYHVLCPNQSLTARVSNCFFAGLLLVGAIYATYSTISKYVLTSSIPKDLEKDPNDADLVEKARQSLGKTGDFLLGLADMKMQGNRCPNTDRQMKMGEFLMQQNRFDSRPSIVDDVIKCFREAGRLSDYYDFLGDVEIPNSETITKVLTGIQPLCELLINFAEDPLVDKWNTERKNHS